MTKVLTVLGHRSEKVNALLPYCGVEYDTVRITTHSDSLSLSLKLITTIPIRLLMRYSPSSCQYSKQLLKSYNPDIVITQGGRQAYPLMLETKRAQKKFVMRLGGHIYDEYRENTAVSSLYKKTKAVVFGSHYWFMFKNLQNADRIIVVTKDMKNRLCAETGKKPESVSIVPVHINMSKFDMPKIDHDGYKLLTIINLNFLPKVKAMLEYLPSIFTGIGDIKKLRYKLIAPGNYSDKLTTPLMEKYRQQLEISGFVQDVASEYLSSDIFAYFSHLDGCPNVVLEAWASKLPVIVNRASWSEELVQHGKTGLLADTAEDARRYILQLLREKNMRDDLSMQGYEYVKRHHSAQIAGKILGEVLRGI